MVSSNEEQVPNQDEGGHAHHLKFGNIDTAGFGTIADLEREHTTFYQRAKNNGSSSRSSVERNHRKVLHDRAVEVLDAESRRIHDKRRYLFRKPRALQYFRGHTLVRSDEERGPGRLELFFDLTFVGLVSVGGEEVSSNPSGAALVRFLLTFSAEFLIWSWMREFFNAFYKDDLDQRLMVLFVMACLIVFGNNSTHAELRHDAGGNARAVTIASYLLAELCIFSHYVFYSFHIKAYRIQLLSHTGIWLCTSALWIGTIFVSERAAVAMATVALVVEFAGWFVIYSPPFKRALKLNYSSATNIEHQLERHADFLTLVTGEFVASAFKGQPAGIGFHDRSGRAIMTLMTAWAFQLMYINGGGSLKIIHPIRHSVYTVAIYFTVHIPLVAAMTVCGDAMGEMIKETHVSSGLRWLVCETYAVTMLGMWVLAMIEVEEDAKGMLWVPKWARIFPRVIVTLIAVFLPFTYQKPAESGETESAFGMPALLRLAEEPVRGGVTTIQKPSDDISTTKLLGILTALAVGCLLWELVSGLNGPNMPHEAADDHLIALASDATQGDGHTTAAALRTPAWTGVPTLVEPGSFSFDYSRQRGSAPLADQAEVAEEEEEIYDEGQDDLHRHPSGTHLHPSHPNKHSDGPEVAGAGPGDAPTGNAEDSQESLADTAWSSGTPRASRLRPGAAGKDRARR